MGLDVGAALSGLLHSCPICVLGNVHSCLSASILFFSLELLLFRINCTVQDLLTDHWSLAVSAPLSEKQKCVLFADLVLQKIVL